MLPQHQVPGWECADGYFPRLDQDNEHPDTATLGDSIREWQDIMEYMKRNGSS